MSKHGATLIACGKPADQVTFLIHHHRSETYRDRLARRFPQVRQVVLDNYRDLGEVLGRERPDVVLSFKIAGQGAFPREQLLTAPSVRWLQASGAGIDHLVPWDPGKVMVTNASGIHGEPLAMLGTWAVLNQVMTMPRYAEQQRQSEWRAHEMAMPTGDTVAIVGFGRIGEAIGRKLRSFGFNVVGVRRHPEPSNAADQVVGLDRLPDVLGEAKHVVLILPSTPETRGLFDAAMLGRMRPGAHLINIARGGIVDETALLDALSVGHIGAATLDVFATEPLPADSRLWHAPNVVITPHAIGDVAGWQGLAADLFADNLERWLEGKGVFNLCSPALGY